MLICNEEYLKECDCGGDAGCGGDGCCAGGGISTGDILGTCDHSSGGYLGPGCFHVPFPVQPMISRYGWSCGRGKKKKKKYANGLDYDNPYVGKIKTIVGETDGQVPAEYYDGSALKEFEMVVAEQDPVFADVLYFNRTLELAWSVQDNGILIMYKPMPNETGDAWNICKTHLTKSGMISFLDKTGPYSSQNEALTEIWNMSKKHEKLLKEHFRSVLDEQRYDPRDIMRWEASGRNPAMAPRPRRPNVNARGLETELKRRFAGQFIDVKLDNRTADGEWKLELTVDNMPENFRVLRGQQRVRTVVPQIDNIIRFLRIRQVEISQPDISAVGV